MKGNFSTPQPKDWKEFVKTLSSPQPAVKKSQKKACDRICENCSKNH